ncbi:hypothetical protein [Desulfopila aestuarii]|nr:hypothetical protein [Desulfopila aestuarii]
MTLFCGPGWWVTATPGNVIDYSWITKQISDDAEKLELQEIAFDR